MYSLNSAICGVNSIFMLFRVVDLNLSSRRLLLLSLADSCQLPLGVMKLTCSQDFTTVVSVSTWLDVLAERRWLT